MKKKKPESNIQILTSEKDELLLLINDLNESIQAKWIEKNKRKYKKISRRLADLNNTVDNEIRIVSVHNKQRKQLENLQSELLGMNWLLNQYPTDYNQTLKFYNQSQQVYNQQLTDNINIRQNNELNGWQTQIIEVSDNNQKRKTEWNWNTWRTLWFVAAWVWLWALIYSWFKKLFWKDEESEEKDVKETEEKNNKKNEEEDEKRETADESDEKYDESLVKRFKDMVKSLKSNWKIEHNEKHGISSLHADWSDDGNKEYHISLSKVWSIDSDFEDSSLTYFSYGWNFIFYWKDGTSQNKISNKKLKEVLDMYDRYIRKYG